MLGLKVTLFVYLEYNIQEKYDNYLILSRNHEMYLRKITENSLSALDEKRY